MPTHLVQVQGDFQVAVSKDRNSRQSIISIEKGVGKEEFGNRIAAVRTGIEGILKQDGGILHAVSPSGRVLITASPEVADKIRTLPFVGSVNENQTKSATSPMQLNY